MLKDLTIFQAIKIGGPVMYFLLVASVLSIAVVLDRLFYYYVRSQVPRQVFMSAVRQHLLRGDLPKAIATAKACPAPFAAVVLAGLNASDFDEKEISAAMEREIIVEVSALERRTAIVATIGSTAVYIGLLGTVWGIIRTFRDISQIGSGGIEVVIGGISEALVCTATGLLVAIPAVIAHNYFVKRINAFVTDMELCASEVAGLINRRKLMLDEKNI